MPSLPKLRVRYDTEDEREERTLELEEGKDFFYGSIAGEPLVAVEGQPVYSYKELVSLCSRDIYKDKEFLKVELREVALGGG